MIHLSDYSFKEDSEAIDRLKNRTVDLHTPLQLGGFFAMFSPNEAPKKCKYYSIYWFKNNGGKTIKKSIYISPNNH